MRSENAERLFRFAVSTVATAGVVAVLWICTNAKGAPALKGRPDTVTGQLATESDSPTLYTDCDPEWPYWLVFADGEAETRIMAGHGAGDRVKASGRLMAGGAYRYLVVERIESE